MKFFINNFIFGSMFLLSLIVLQVNTGYAQEAPPPQNPDGGTGISVTSDFEKALLTGFFEALNNQQSKETDAAGSATDIATVTIADIVADVLKTVVAEESTESDANDGDSDVLDDNEASQEGSDDDGNGDSKGKNKGKGKDKNKGKAKDKNKGKDKDKDTKKNKDKSENSLPPGLQKQLAKNGTLPPGLQRKLEASGELPPGLQARALPLELEAELPLLPEGQKRVIADDAVLIIDEVLGTVLDRIPNVIPPELAQILNGLPDLLNQ